MARNEQFKRYVEAGTAFLGMTQQRAEAIVKDLVSSGDVARSQAQKAVEWLVERSQRGTDELLAIVRREVKAQIEALGLATKDDVARIEARLEAQRASPAASAAGGAPAPNREQVAAPVRRRRAGEPGNIPASPAAGGPPGTASRTRKAAAPRGPTAPAPSPAPARGAGKRSAKAAPITKAASRKRRPTAPDSAEG